MMPYQRELRPAPRAQPADMAGEGSAAAAGWLGVVFGFIVLLVVSAYLVRASRYHGSGFTEVVAWPTLFAALGFLVQQVVALAKRRPLLTERTERSPAGPAPGTDVEEPRAPKRLQLRGLLVAACLAVGYVALLTSLGFVIDSVVMITAGPIACGQPLRRLPVLAGAGLALVGILAAVVRLSGVVPLPGGVFHIGVP